VIELERIAQGRSAQTEPVAPPEAVAAIPYTVFIRVRYPHPWWCGYLGMPASLRCVP
jgi:hypothetical protein